MTDLVSIIQYLDRLLETSRYADASLNGLQVESSNQKIDIIAFAVDAGLSVIESAIEQKASLLIVHHGIFWGKEKAIRGAFRDKIEKLLNAGCSLYTSHIPLDAHKEVGNNYELARLLGLKELNPFFEYNGEFIACSGTLDKPEGLNYFTERLAKLDGAIEPLILPFGKDKITRVGVITGSGSEALAETLKQDLDLLVSGEPKHESYHTAKELGVNAIFAGHYATETIGPKSLMKKMAKDFEIKTIFIHEGTGI